MTTQFRTVAQPARVEIPKIKGSRFIADVTPINEAGDVECRLELLRAEFADARHHCWAWRMGPAGGEYRYSDDGEPSGTAGRPILQHLQGVDVTNVLLVVVRYFGGTKLGAGGLVRAYGNAAAAVLAAAEIEDVVVSRRVWVEHDYDETAAVAAFTVARGISPSDTKYGARIELSFDVPVVQVDGFVAELLERTGGRVRVKAQD